MLSKWDSYCRVDLGSPSQNFFRAPRARSAGKSMEHSYRYRLRFGTRFGCQNFRASFPGISKTSRLFPLVFCTMNYTVVGSQIPDLSKETHKKTSMTVHLSLKCECSGGKTTPCKHESPVPQQGWERVWGAWERVGRGWERVGRGLGEGGRGLGEGGRGLGEGGRELREGWERVGEGWERVVQG